MTAPSANLVGPLVAVMLLAGCGLVPEGEEPAPAIEPPIVAGAAGPGRETRLIRLADGDSGWFEVDGREVEVRLLGYNAPERYEGDDRSTPGCNGAAAEAALTELLEGADVVTLVGDETDRFGRLLVDLLVDGRSAVELLVGAGRGLSIGDPGPTRDLMRAAAADGRGMWGDQCGTPAADGLAVTRVEPDPPGRDEDDLNGEWVELVNRGPDPIDLSGWAIRDDTSSHRFALSGSIAPGASLTVRTGSGRSGDGQVFLHSPSPVWSNRTDTVLVIDPAGVVAAWGFVG